METLFVGKNIIFLPETESTNSYATALLKNVNVPEGTVVDTAHQTQGKGQRGSGWNTEASSNLTCSIVIKPEFLNIEKQFFLYQIAALACYDTTAEILNNGQFDIKIKWPNDILVNGRKICGILIENNVVVGKLNWCVIGVGLNINQEHFRGLERATSLYLTNGKRYDLRYVLGLLCKHFEKYYLALKAEKNDVIEAEYRKNFYALNRVRAFEYEGKRQNMKVKGVASSGLLLLEDEHNRLHEVDVKQVKWLY